MGIVIEAAGTADRLADIARELGITGQSRIAECIAALRAAVDDLRTTGAITGNEKVQRFALAFQDATLIRDTFASLYGVNEYSDIADRLRTAFVGGDLLVPEDTNDHPRNELWTLFVCARLRNEGYVPQFAENVCDPHEKKPDLFVTSKGIRLAVEAKRNRSRAMLANRIDKAVTQIGTAVRAGHCMAGFLAIDVSFSLGQHAQHRPWSIANDDAIQSVREQVIQIMAPCIQEVHAVVARHADRNHVLGGTFLALPVILRTDTRNIGLIRHFVSVPFDEATVVYRELVDHCFADK